MSQDIDDGLDGIMFVRAMVVDAVHPNDRRRWTHRLAGSAVLLQIKGGDTQISSQTDEHIRVKVTDLQSHKENWLKSPIPCALVFVEPVAQGKTPSKAWWANLQDPGVYVSDGLVQIPKKNRFQVGLECRGSFSKLVKRQQLNAAMQQIELDQTTIDPSRKVTGLQRQGLKWEAWRFYKEWQQRGSLHPVLGRILINRTGWSHITRQGRNTHRIGNSLLLLPAVERVLSEVESWEYLRKLPPLEDAGEREGESDVVGQSTCLIDYLGIRAKVISKWRSPTEIMVVLRRRIVFQLEPNNEPANPQLTGPPVVTLWFYSVYEPTRGKRS